MTKTLKQKMYATFVAKEIQPRFFSLKKNVTFLLLNENDVSLFFCWILPCNSVFYDFISYIELKVDEGNLNPILSLFSNLAIWNFVM